jgi:hypothetical protein
MLIRKKCKDSFADFSLSPFLKLTCDHRGKYGIHGVLSLNLSQYLFPICNLISHQFLSFQSLFKNYVRNIVTKKHNFNIKEREKGGSLFDCVWILCFNFHNKTDYLQSDIFLKTPAEYVLRGWGIVNKEIAELIDNFQVLIKS